MTKGRFLAGGALAFNVFVASFVPSSRAHAADCTGNDCLVVYNVRKGTRCGKASSVEVDFRNMSDLSLRGYIVFETPKGKSYQPTGLMAPGEDKKNIQFVCDGTGEVGAIANVGKEPTYPKHP